MLCWYCQQRCYSSKHCCDVLASIAVQAVAWGEVRAQTMCRGLLWVDKQRDLSALGLLRRKHRELAMIHSTGDTLATKVLPGAVLDAKSHMLNGPEACGLACYCHVLCFKLHCLICSTTDTRNFTNATTCPSYLKQYLVKSRSATCLC